MSDRETFLNKDELKKELREQTRRLEEEHSSLQYAVRAREARRDLLRLVAVIIAMLCAGASAFLLLFKTYTYSTYDLVHELELSKLTRSSLYSYADGAVLLGLDEMSYISDGKVIWTQPESLSNPIIAIRDDYFAVCDTDGYEAFICDREGILSTVKVSRKIRNLKISSAGVIAIFTESEDAAYISYFDRFGTKIDVEVKTAVDQSGYPVSMAISPDGQKLAVSYYSLQNGIGESYLLVYDFENGNERDSYIVADYRDLYENDLFIADVEFPDNENLIAIGDTETLFVSFGGLEIKRTELVYPKTPQSVFLTDSYFGIVFEPDSEGGKSELSLYEMDAELFRTYEIEGTYDTIMVTDEYAVEMNGAEIRFYQGPGINRYEGALVDAPISVTLLKNGSLLINTGVKLQEIRLK